MSLLSSPPALQQQYMPMENNPKISGAGPFDFINESELGVGERLVYPFRDMKKGKVKGGYRKYLPFSSVTVTNLSNESNLTVEINHSGVNNVPPNTVETIDSLEVTSIIVINDGPSPIAIGDVRIECVKSQYGSDDKAREELQQTPIESFVSNTLGL